MSARPSVLLVGCGKMGGAMLDGWLKSNSCESITILDPTPPTETILSHKDVQHITNISDLGTDIEIVFLATKPQIMNEVCKSLSSTKRLQSSLILSIAAGKTLSYFSSYFPANPIIRAMPNTPSAIGKGSTVFCSNEIVSEKQQINATELLKVSGHVHTINDESLMDSVTALSGSGPAYVFLLIEILKRCGENLGLDPKLSSQLAKQTVIGSVHLAEQSQEDASTLRKNVTSPGGTTEAALGILMNGELEEIYKKALAKARDRGHELSA